MSPGNPFILGSEGKRSRSPATRSGSLHSCECWLLLVGVYSYTDLPQFHLANLMYDNTVRFQTYKPCDLNVFKNISEAKTTV